MSNIGPRHHGMRSVAQFAETEKKKSDFDRLIEKAVQGVLRPEPQAKPVLPEPSKPKIAAKKIEKPKSLPLPPRKIEVLSAPDPKEVEAKRRDVVSLQAKQAEVAAKIKEIEARQEDDEMALLLLLAA